MRKVILLLTMLALMALALFAGKAPRNTAPTVTVSCSVCTATQPMTIGGYNFAPRTNVRISVTGPNYLSMNTTPDSRGNISVYYPVGMGFAPGYYTLTATQTSGASATTGFEIQ